MPPDIIVVPSRGPPSSPLAGSGYTASAAEGAGSGTQLGKGERILIVEDDLLVASQMEAALSDAGFDVVGTAATREEALHQAQAQSPAVVVMDIHLPGDGDGIDAALELFRLHGIRCIFASAYSDNEARQRAEPAAPLGWLQKPYTMASLTEMVRAAVSEVRSPYD
jgi:DNA-binding NarL/FixJ family response regulator